MDDAELSRKVAGMALQTLVLEVERGRRERKRADLYKKLLRKYRKCRAKHQSVADLYRQDPEFQVFREGLKEREAQLERRGAELEVADGELVRAVARNSKLEALLRAKDDELELNRGVAAENADLQQRVAGLTADLDVRKAEIDRLKGELGANADKLAALQRQVALPRSEEAGCHSRPSSSRPQSGRGPHRSTHEIWVYAEARLNIYRALHAEGRATETEVQAVRKEAHTARESCGYYPDSPDGEDAASEDVDRLDSDAWYEEAYPTGGGS
ncbi:PREDICTED: uncharacterized protein LOC109218216 [Nicotiana attenuata]|uniref:uncharacterized protein LOC109218216 n=1 Tax=Nicotiana attenuata TaxID=49451 RepID=UPI000904E1A5|nr:PREDICTED: uncharacterized protein LOC109218216 [Nicotiana attenuata]